MENLKQQITNGTRVKTLCGGMDFAVSSYVQYKNISNKHPSRKIKKKHFNS